MTLDDLVRSGFTAARHATPGWRVKISDIVATVKRYEPNEKTIIVGLDTHIPKIKLAWRLLATATVLEVLFNFYFLARSGANTNTALLGLATILTAAAGGHFGGLHSVYKKARDYLLNGRDSFVYTTSLF